jgi:hypothetical protein
VTFRGGEVATIQYPRHTRILIALAITVTALAITTSFASAAATRAEYVAQVEPICRDAQKPTFKAYSALFKATPTAGQTQINKAVARRADRALGRFYTRISNIFGLTTSQIASITPAPGDEGTVAAWLAGRSQAQMLGLQAGRAAKHLKVRRATRLTSRATSASDQAAALVSTFGFKFCAFSLGDAEL